MTFVTIVTIVTVFNVECGMFSVEWSASRWRMLNEEWSNSTLNNSTSPKANIQPSTFNTPHSQLLLPYNHCKFGWDVVTLQALNWVELSWVNSEYFYAQDRKKYFSRQEKKISRQEKINLSAERKNNKFRRKMQGVSDLFINFELSYKIDFQVGYEYTLNSVANRL